MAGAAIGSNAHVPTDESALAAAGQLGVVYGYSLILASVPAEAYDVVPGMLSRATAVRGSVRPSGPADATP